MTQLEHITKKDCDILFLQEVDDNAYLYRNLEKLGYECMFTPKKFNYGSQGILLAYKLAKFDLLRYRVLEYSGQGDGWKGPLQMKGNNCILMQVLAPPLSSNAGPAAGPSTWGTRTSSGTPSWRKSSTTSSLGC